jgi:hypothetical protein
MSRMRLFGVLFTAMALTVVVAAPLGAQTDEIPVSGFSYQTDYWGYTDRFGGNVYHQEFTEQVVMFGDPMLAGWMESKVTTVENYGVGTSNVSHEHFAFSLWVNAYPGSGWTGSGVVKGTVTPGTFHPFEAEGLVVANGFGVFEGMQLRLDTHEATSTLGRADYEGVVIVPGG